MSIWKSFGSIYLITWITQWALFWLVKRHSAGYFHAHVVHLEHVVKLELFMVLGSFFIWKRVTSLLLEIPSTKQKDSFGDNELSARRSYRQQPASSSSASKRGRSMVSAFLISFLLCCHLSQFLNYFANAVEPRIISWICLTNFGIWIHLVAFLIGFSIVNFCVRYVSSKSFGKKILAPIFSRSRVIQELLINVKWQTVIALLLSIVFAVFLFLSAGHPRVKRIEVVLQKLPKSMDGFKIALLTDMHAGPTVGRKAFTRAVELTNEQKPDIVAIVGDLVDGATEDLKEAVEPIGRLKSKHGVYFTTGNHELYYGEIDDWITYLKSLNVRVLRNEHVRISPAPATDGKAPDTYLCLAGADDIYASKTGIDGHGMDLRAAVNGCSTHSPVVLMAHNPRAAKEALELERKIDLILCGHTHAGQMYILAPFMYVMMPFFHGLYKYAQTGTLIYVSAGVFYMGAPMKMFAMSEIIVITLKAPV